MTLNSMKSHLYCIVNFSSRDPLSNHIATVASYVNQYHNANLNEKKDLFVSFAHYLVGRCWKKMLRRIDLWSSVGFLARLYAMKDELLLDAFSKCSNITISYKKDEALCDLLANLPVQDVMKHSGLKVDLSKLKSLFDTVLQKGKGAEIPCDESAFLEFHQLLIAALSGYRRALRVFSDREITDVKRQATATNIWNFSHLLWRIAHSRILRLYLSALDNIGALTLPVPGDAHVSRCLAEERDEITLTPRPLDDEDLGAVEEEEDEEQRRLMNDTADVSVTLLRWIRLQVNHFAALNILSARPKKTVFQEVRMTLIAANQRRAEASEKEPWADTIRKLSLISPTDLSSADSRTFDAQVAIDVLQKLIDDRTIRPNEPTTMRYFRDWGHSLPGSLHCEAALAALSEFPELAVHPDYAEKETLLQIVSVCANLY
jgi:hypothetical protein